MMMMVLLLLLLLLLRLLLLMMMMIATGADTLTRLLRSLWLGVFPSAETVHKYKYML